MKDIVLKRKYFFSVCCTYKEQQVTSQFFKASLQWLASLYQSQKFELKFWSCSEKMVRSILNILNGKQFYRNVIGYL